MVQIMKLLSLLALLFISLIPQAKSFELDVKAFEHLAIQSGGRLKPFDSYARESVQLITGATFYQGKNPTELVLAWLFFPDQWATKEFFQIKHFELKKILGVEKTKDYLSPQEITQNPKLQELFKELNIKQREKKKLDGLFTAVNRLGNQINAYQEIISGQGIKLVPQRISQN
jgi:hypothetical protein